MSVKLHQSAYDYAQKMIQNRRCVLDQPSDWTDHRPARNAEDKFIAAHGLGEFGRWHLREDDEAAERSKGRYKFPYGGVKNVHRCAVFAASCSVIQIYRYRAGSHAAAPYARRRDGEQAFLGEAPCSFGLTRCWSRGSYGWRRTVSRLSMSSRSVARLRGGQPRSEM
jgi:hypothetical protein